MISDEERREVARKLRELGPSADKNIIGCDTVCQRVDEIIGTIECGSWEVFFDRLADLIDPTCHDTMPDWWTFECSECGTKWSVYQVYICPDGTYEHDEEEPRFCPNCGARVIGGNDAD